MREIPASHVRRPMDYLPAFSIGERDRRWNLLRKRMGVRGLDALLVWAADGFFGTTLANFRYLTGVLSKHGGVCVFPLEGEPVVLNPPPHLNKPFNFYATAQQWIIDIRPLVDIDSVKAVIQEMGLTRATFGLVGFQSQLARLDWPPHILDELSSSFPQARFVEATDIVTEARLIKSKEEIFALEKASELAYRSILRLWETAAPGVKECELVAAIIHEQVAAGGELHPFILLCSGPADGPPNVWHLVHGVETHTQRPLEPGDLVVTEFHTSWGGYLAGAEFALFLGDPPGPLQALHDVAIECLGAAVEAMRPGATLRECWEAMRMPMLRRNLAFVELGFHGHGLASPEWPTVVYPAGEPPLDGRSLGSIKLEVGMVLGLNIDIYDPKWRPDVGIMLGDTVVIEEHGARCLVGIPLDLFAKKA